MFLDITAYLLIPFCTFRFARGSNWFTTNFSVLGNTDGYQLRFVLWGVLIGLYFFWSLRQIIARMPQKPHGTWLAPAALILLIFAVTTPYLPESFPVKSILHVIFAFTASVCLLLCLCLTVWQLYQLEPETYLPFLGCLAVIALVSLFLFFLAGIISSALEIFFTITAAILTRQLYSSLA